LRACALNRLPAREVACRLGGSIVDIASPVSMCACAGAGAQHRPACRLRLSQAGTGTCLRYDLTCPQRHRDLPTLRLDLPTAAPGLAYVTTCPQRHRDLPTTRAACWRSPSTGAHRLKGYNGLPTGGTRGHSPS
jgi:hypothetical protein